MRRRRRSRRRRTAASNASSSTSRSRRARKRPVFWTFHLVGGQLIFKTQLLFRFGSFCLNSVLALASRDPACSAQRAPAVNHERIQREVQRFARSQARRDRPDCREASSRRRGDL
eukprot:3997043-Pleurochrysis_carterae.AAC.1